jgi:hypothetical protein
LTLDPKHCGGDETLDRHNQNGGGKHEIQRRRTARVDENQQRAKPAEDKTETGDEQGSLERRTQIWRCPNKPKWTAQWHDAKRDKLKQNPYITEVTVISFSFLIEMKIKSWLTSTLVNIKWNWEVTSSPSL